MRHLVVAALLVAAAAPAVSATPLASDFEIAAMEKQIARTRDARSLIAARLNLGDARSSRGEARLAQIEYERAGIAAGEARVAARERSSIGDYALLTAYEGLAAAKRRRRGEAFDLFEEAVRYGSENPKIWNVYASGMLALQMEAKAEAAARAAIATAERRAGGRRSRSSLLDVAIYRYSAASAIEQGGNAARRNDATELLEAVIATLDDRAFGRMRKRIVEREAFEIYSSVDDDTQAYLSLRHRTHLRIARLREAEGATAAARAHYAAALALRSDDAIALAGEIRLATDAEERESLFARAFDANPFSLELHRLYSEFGTARDAYRSRTVAKGGRGATGALVRSALDAERRGDAAAAERLLAQVAREFPDNDVVALLRARSAAARGDRSAARRFGEAIADARLRRQAEEAVREAIDPLELLPPSADDPLHLDAGNLGRLAQALRGSIDGEVLRRLESLRFVNQLTFDAAGYADGGTTIFESGSIEDLPVRFSRPTAFRGSFHAGEVLTLEYRIAGATVGHGGRPVLLIDAIGVSR